MAPLFNTDLTDVFRTKQCWSVPKIMQIGWRFRYRPSKIVAYFFWPTLYVWWRNHKVSQGYINHVTLIFWHTHTHWHTTFVNSYFPVEPGLAGCPMTPIIFFFSVNFQEDIRQGQINGSFYRPQAFRVTNQQCRSSVALKQKGMWVCFQGIWH